MSLLVSGRIKHTSKYKAKHKSKKYGTQVSAENKLKQVKNRNRKRLSRRQTLQRKKERNWKFSILLTQHNIDDYDDDNEYDDDEYDEPITRYEYEFNVGSAQV